MLAIRAPYYKSREIIESDPFHRAPNTPLRRTPVQLTWAHATSTIRQTVDFRASIEISVRHSFRELLCLNFTTEFGMCSEYNRQSRADSGSFLEALALSQGQQKNDPCCISVYGVSEDQLIFAEIEGGLLTAKIFEHMPTSFLV